MKAICLYCYESYLTRKLLNTIGFKIIDKNFHNNKQKQKIIEASWIKDLRLTLSTQEKSIQLKPFN